METIDISVRGQWVRVPSIKFEEKTIVCRGQWLKLARVHDEAWLPSELEDGEGCLQQLQAAKLGADIFTFAQMPPGRKPEYDFPVEFDSIAAIPLTDRKAWWEGLPQETRKNVRRSVKYGVRVEIRPFDDDLVKHLMELNNSQELRQGRRYTHFGKSLEQVKKDHMSFVDRSEFFCAFYEEELIGFIKLVYRGKIASILNVLTNDKHKERRAANALMTAVVERCFEKGLTHLTYGFFHHGNKRDETITVFKVRHGFGEILVPRYFVPLTLWGKISLKAGLHRGVIGVLPASFLAFAVELRARYYRALTLVFKPV